MLKTVVIGASPNPARYSYLATELLEQKGYPVIPVGIRKGFVGPLPIIVGKPTEADVDTVTLYVGPANQEEWKEYIISLKPRRVLFNPGTENTAIEHAFKDAGIQTERACTLVLLNTGQY